MKLDVGSIVQKSPCGWVVGWCVTKFMVQTATKVLDCIVIKPHDQH